MLDDDVEALYARLETPFRPRFYPIVAHLLETGSAQVGELARSAGVSQPAVSQTLVEMEKLGLVEVSVAEDRRARSVALSPEGKVVVARLEPVWAAIDAAAGELDAELPCPLSELLDAAAAALRKRSFLDRIDHNLEGYRDAPHGHCAADRGDLRPAGVPGAGGTSRGGSDPVRGGQGRGHRQDRGAP